MGRHQRLEDSDEFEGSAGGISFEVGYEARPHPQPNNTPDGYAQLSMLPVRSAAVQPSSIPSRHNPSIDRSVMRVNAVLNPDPQPGWYATGASSTQDTALGPQEGFSRHNRPPQQSASPWNSTSQSPGPTRRPSRPDYSDEETIWVWYHRIDLSWSW